MPIIAAIAAPLAFTFGFFNSVAPSGDGKKANSSKAKVNKKQTESTTKTVRGSTIADPPPNLPNTWFTIVGDFLYWRADEDGLTYALDDDNNKAKGLDPDFEWKPGYRAGVGFQFNRDDNWDMMFIWTGLNSHAEDSKTINQDSFGEDRLSPRWVPSLLGTAATHASVDWKLKYNTIDWYMGRDFFVGKKLTFHPIAGIRGAWISQDYDVHYRSQFANSGFASTSFDADTSFKGVGMRAGIDIKYHVNNNFGLCGNLAGAFFYGWTNVKEKIHGFQTNPAGIFAPVDFTYRHNFQGTRTNLDGGLGFLVEGDIRRSGPHISLTVKYEFSEWFSQNVLTNLGFQNGSSTPTSSDQQDRNLGLQGLTIDLRLDF
ncbi:MAG: hypothetical protein JSR58_04340 [Verrucomicrobia bacterium]|nr:hypothetical protein [Verrucomicrobiota bacterium]